MKTQAHILVALLAFVVTLATRLDAAETGAATVNADQLVTFMEKCKASPPHEFPVSPTDWPLLVKALAQDPHGPWGGYLDILATDARFQIRRVKREERQQWAASLLSTLEQAENTYKELEAAGITVTNQAEFLVLDRARYLETKEMLSLEAGKNLAALKANAQRKLAEAKDPNDWNYGNLVYRANERLGRVALREGRVAQAREYLRAAGCTPGSPQLNSFGPDLLLARELLEHGEPEDRIAVLSFLDDVARFWANPEQRRQRAPGDYNGIRVADDHLKQLNAWRQMIRDGEIPDDYKWR